MWKNMKYLYTDTFCLSNIYNSENISLVCINPINIHYSNILSLLQDQAAKGGVIISSCNDLPLKNEGFCLSTQGKW